MKNDRFRCENLGLDHDPIHPLASALVQRAAKAICTCLVTRCGGRGALGQHNGIHRALLLVHNLRELQHTLCCSHVRGESQCGDGDEVAAEGWRWQREPLGCHRGSRAQA